MKQTPEEKNRITRINRRLAKAETGWPCKLFASRSLGEKSNLGNYYVRNTHHNTVVWSRIKLLDWEKDLEEYIRLLRGLYIKKSH
jgi:hypothetical protein